MVPQFKSTWDKMKELVVLSLNVIYLKDTLQQCERFCSRLQYLNIETGSEKITILNLQQRKHNLNKRIKDLVEDILNSKKEQSVFSFSIQLEHASLTRKQLEKGYALYSNMRNDTYALSLRNGALFIIHNPEENVIEPSLSFLEYTAKHEGAVYKYFEIDQTDPLKGNLRY